MMSCTMRSRARRTLASASLNTCLRAAQIALPDQRAAPLLQGLNLNIEALHALPRLLHFERRWPPVSKGDAATRRDCAGQSRDRISGGLVSRRVPLYRNFCLRPGEFEIGACLGFPSHGGVQFLLQTWFAEFRQDLIFAYRVAGMHENPFDQPCRFHAHFDVVGGFYLAVGREDVRDGLARGLRERNRQTRMRFVKNQMVNAAASAKTIETIFFNSLRPARSSRRAVAIREVEFAMPSVSSDESALPPGFAELDERERVPVAPGAITASSGFRGKTGKYRMFTGLPEPVSGVVRVRLLAVRDGMPEIAVRNFRRCRLRSARRPSNRNIDISRPRRICPPGAAVLWPPGRLQEDLLLLPEASGVCLRRPEQECAQCLFRSLQPGIHPHLTYRNAHARYIINKERWKFIRRRWFCPRGECSGPTRQARIRPSRNWHPRILWWARRWGR